MKPGTYKISFLVDLNDYTTHEEASQAVAAMISEALDDDNFPEVEFELVELLDLEYNYEEEIEELNF